MLRLSLLLACTSTLILAAVGRADEAAKPAAPVARPAQVPPDHPERAKKGLELFRSSVRQILTERCLNCHGGNSTKADFDLSTREALLSSGFVGQSADESQLVDLITHAVEPHMPWKEPKLSDEQIARIRTWIDLGAPYDAPLGNRPRQPAAELTITDQDRRFWSFRPLQNTPVPPVADAAWCRNPIDHFIRDRQAAAGLNPNPAADRRILIRRASFDLLGLPPTPEDIEAFVNDPDPDAWPELVDRLLAQPQYGERWARHWMDVARFAESHGYEQDYDRPHAWHYRDFLIRAFNEDMPWNQLVQWQLAGDELAPGNPNAMMATGFLGAGAFPTQLTEAEFESARYDELDDMVMTTGVAFLGLSVGCARCHDHKFDPIPARDYYSLAATFTTTIRSETQLDLAPEVNLRRKTDFENHLQSLRQAAAEYRRTQLPAKLQAWLVDHPAEDSAGPWELLHIESVKSSAGTTFRMLPDGSALAESEVPAQEVITIIAQSRRAAPAALRLETLTHDSLPRRGPGRAPNGNFALGNIQLQLLPEAGNDNPVSVPFTAARATHQQDTGNLSVAASIDNDPVSGWAVDVGGIGNDQAAVFDFGSPQNTDKPGPHRWAVTLTFNHPNARHSAGRFRLSLTSQLGATPQVGTAGPDSRVLAALQSLRDGNTNIDSPEYSTALDWFATQDPQMLKLQQEVAEAERKGPQLEMATVMVTSEGLPHMRHHADDRGFPHFYPDTYLLKRGDVHQKQERVEAGFLQVLTPANADRSRWNVTPPEGWTRTSFRRAALANWITDSRDGGGALLARVIVNRLWQHHFGRGIVATPNDFGISGERPTHPELLEWLAQELIRNNYSLKSMHRLILTSSTWMQSGQFDETRAAIDRDNMLHWRRAPQRLEAEAIRDSMLTVAGLLDKTQYGPGTLDQNMTRRSIYFFIKRSQLIPIMMLFDWPEHLVSIGQRPVTTIAPQALMFMNSPQGRRYASAFADRLGQGTAVEISEKAWLLAFGRRPTDAEREAALQFLAGTDPAAPPSRETLVNFCQTLCSMNEFVYVD
ncbi:MAG: hypothetical protein RLZZ436_2418 [Planctomycetota bacterium]|jgi:mono/diheme cytochrome c family protein